MNKINEFIESKQGVGFHFKPSREFYLKVKIKQRRFGQLLRNEKSPTIDELTSLANFFDVRIEDLIKN